MFLETDNLLNGDMVGILAPDGSCNEALRPRLDDQQVRQMYRDMLMLRLYDRKAVSLWRPHPKTTSAIRGLPPQYFNVISASKARRVWPVMLDAARRRSTICDGLGNGWP